MKEIVYGNKIISTIIPFDTVFIFLFFKIYIYSFTQYKKALKY